MVATFDSAKFYINSHDLMPAPTTFSGGRGVGGFKQNTLMQNDYWRGTLNLNAIFGKDTLAYRGFIAALRGQSGVFNLDVCDPYALKGTGKTHEEWLVLLGLNIADLCGPVAGKYSLPFSDGTCFTDGTGFVIPDFVIASPTANVAAGASSMSMNSAAGFLLVGNDFSTLDHYLHRVTGILGSVVSFTPPLRRALVVGEPLETQNPKIRVKLSSDTSGAPRTNHGRYTDPVSMSVEEVMKR